MYGNEPEGAEDDVRNPSREKCPYSKERDEDYEEILIEREYENLNKDKR